MSWAVTTRTLATMLVVVAACGDNTGGGSTEAARADSSAAGYAVDQRNDSGHAVRDTAAPAVLAALPNAGQPALPAATTAGGTTRASSPAPLAGKPKAAIAADTMRVAATHRQALPNGRLGPARVDSLPVVVPVPTGPVRVNEFLTYDARSRTVSLQLIAGYNGLNGSLNYNGSTNGSHGISVPMGWRVHVAVVNRDSDLQHSAIVVNEVLPPPIEPTSPAFAGAALPQLDEGLHEDETGTLDFVASHEGRYMIACGVAGHAQAGMWLQLAVVKDAPAPAYR